MMLGNDGIWVIGEHHLARIMSQVDWHCANLPQAGGLFDLPNQDDAPESALVVEDATAIIPIKGVMLSSVPDFFRFFGIEATDMGETAALVDEAAGRGDVRSIFFDISSPGGSVAGLENLVSAIRAAGMLKPTAGHIDSLGASAAIWAGSQAKTLTANETAVVGSVGVFTVLVDASKAFEEAGIRVLVVSSGDKKGDAFGAPVSAERVAETSEIVNDLAALFQRDVQKARNLTPDQMAEVARGGVTIAAKAIELGLIDKITTRENALVSAQPAAQEGPPMTQQTKDQAAAQAAELTALREANAKLEADAAVAKAAQAKAEALAAAVQATGTAVRIEAAVKEGRILPPARSHVEAYAAHCTPEELDAFIATMPVQTSPKPAGISPARPKGIEEAAAGTDPTDPQEVEFHKHFADYSDAQGALAMSVGSVGLDNMVTMADGSRETLEKVAADFGLSAAQISDLGIAPRS